MTPIPLHFGTDPKQLVCEVDVPRARFVLTGQEGVVLGFHETTSLHAFNFGRRVVDEVFQQTFGDREPVAGVDCDLCGRRCQDGEYAEWRMPGGGRNAVVHHACVVELVSQRRRERASGQPELFTVGGGR